MAGLRHSEPRLPTQTRSGDVRGGLESEEGHSQKLLASKSNYFTLKELRIE